MTFLLQIKSWLTTPVVETADFDGPFRLRRVSLWLIVAGWMSFFASCMIGMYVNHHAHLAGYHDLASLLTGRFDTDRFGQVSVQLTAKLAELSGAMLFIGGMISVSLFDKVDRLTTRRAR